MSESLLRDADVLFFHGDEKSVCLCLRWHGERGYVIVEKDRRRHVEGKGRFKKKREKRILQRDHHHFGVEIRRPCILEGRDSKN